MSIVVALGGSASALRSSPPRIWRRSASDSGGSRRPARLPHVSQSTPPSKSSKAGKGPDSLPQRGAGVEERMEPLEREQLPEERRAHQRAGLGRQRAERADEHPVQRGIRLAVLRDLVGGLQHRHRVGEAAVVLSQRAVGVDGLDLRDDVELAAPPVALERDVGGGLEPRAEAAAGLANSLGDAPDLAVPLGQDGDDAVGLSQLDAA